MVVGTDGEREELGIGGQPKKPLSALQIPSVDRPTRRRNETAGSFLPVERIALMDSSSISMEESLRLGATPPVVMSQNTIRLRLTSESSFRGTRSAVARLRPVRSNATVKRPLPTDVRKSSLAKGPSFSDPVGA
jgi:hypothetical protein